MCVSRVCEILIYVSANNATTNSCYKYSIIIYIHIKKVSTTLLYESTTLSLMTSVITHSFVVTPTYLLSIYLYLYYTYTAIPIYTYDYSPFIY